MTARELHLVTKTREKCGLEIDPGDSRGDGSEDLPRNGARFLRDFCNGKMRPEELDFVSWSAAWKIGDVDHDLIHGDSTEDGAALAMD